MPDTSKSLSSVFALGLAASLLLAGCSAEEAAERSSQLPDSPGMPLPDVGLPILQGPGDEADPDAPVDPDAPMIDPEARSFFFSYDESGSTASRDLTLFALAEGRLPDPSLGRPFEFLNAERFDAFGEQPLGPFRVSMALAAGQGNVPVDTEIDGELYALGINVVGPELTRDERNNVVLTVLLDVSGSMEDSYADETRSDIRSLLDVARFGLERMRASLKPGDVINLVTFSTNARVLLEGADGSDAAFGTAINALQTESSTNLNGGLELAYEVANRTFDPQKANRVVLMTDAFLNAGQTNLEIIGDNVIRNGREGILLAGIGIGSRFNDEALNAITDVGRGEYSAMVTPADAERIFTQGFTRFIEPAARDVRFQLIYPQVLNQFLSAAEEISENAEDVQPTNFAFGSEQFFLELFTGPENLEGSARITLAVTYEDADGEPRSAQLSRSLDELFAENTESITAAVAVSTLARLVAGELSCETVLASPLYTNRIVNSVYTVYRQAIGDYCALT